MVKIIGIAGTAKNTGKTTTTTALIEEINKRGMNIGITSIGYDGEEIDNVTGLPKPRIRLRQGTLVAISEKCLKTSSAEIKIIEKTNLITPLGKIIVGKIVGDGLVVLAGPNKSRDLKTINCILKEKNCNLIIVDGALNRLAPMVETHGIILATGAARNYDINLLARETKAIINIFELNKIDKALKDVKCIVLQTGNKGIKRLNSTSLITKETASEIINYYNQTDKVEFVYIPGIVSAEILEEFIDKTAKIIRGTTIVLTDPIKLLVSGNPIHINNLIEKVRTLGGDFAVTKNIPVLCVTINPFYPAYRFNHETYFPDYVDADMLKRTMEKYIDIPVINVVKEGAEKIFSIIKQGG